MTKTQTASSVNPQSWAGQNLVGVPSHILQRAVRELSTLLRLLSVPMPNPEAVAKRVEAENEAAVKAAIDDLEKNGSLEPADIREPGDRDSDGFYLDYAFAEEARRLERWADHLEEYEESNIRHRVHMQRHEAEQWRIDQEADQDDFLEYGAGAL